MKSIFYYLARAIHLFFGIQNCCRFAPTCSQYAGQAFSEFNFFKAAWLTIGRLLRCHPFHIGGFDPLPKR